ncbi:hypothetical protein GGX14DRAFT_429489 [Mycena pura]|uniref:FAD/NAD(P)-binding domain-containing protein n=1 Tax=Mycena pura TaxID=153505 RepID=A0AAD6YJ74_9AGAR|nr:hypothetical protein GGX14DRAFT_429489 [Mycena pura]
MVSHNSLEQPRVVIIGAGVGGMTMAIELKRMGFSNFTIIEKAAEVGGTWRDHIYPGCSSDVAVHFYSLSTELKPDWTHNFALQPAIQEYWLQVARKHDLYANIVFNRKVVSAQWDARAQQYSILTEDLNGTKVVMTAAILVSAVGVLEIPRFPDIPGISRFAGDSFHSARWNNKVSLAGKRVAVIGGGASAMQLVPRISQDPSVQVTQFCRSRTWILPPVRKEFSATHKWLLRHMPFYLRIYRNFQFLMTELAYLKIFGSHSGNRDVERLVKDYMLKATPKEYIHQVIPSDPDLKVGCKRVIFDTSYLASLAQPNMELAWDPIESISEDAILTKKGSTPFDVIIFCTGYITDDYPIPIQGSTDQTVAGYFKAHGGPTAYLGTTIPSFPNFFTLAGANTATGHTSLLFAEEVQVQHILKLIKPIIAGHILSLEVTAEATDAYNRKIQSRLAGFIWAKCFSWYRTGNTGKIHGLFPGPMSLYWWWMRRPNWAHYKVITVGQWKPQQSFYCGTSAAMIGWLAFGVLAAALKWAYI